MAETTTNLPETRRALHQVAVHVLARARVAAAERFGLRPSPGGIATPTFGAEPTVVRTYRDYLVVERTGASACSQLTTLRQAANLAGVDLTTELWVGDATPPMTDPDRPLSLEPASVQVLTEWFHFGSLVLDELVATTPAVGEATTAQLWPEHFDLGITVTVGGDRAARVNIGASPGDDWEPLPYLYVGPHDPNRPGDPSYWNASFGAVLRYEELADLRPADRLAGAISFAGRGLALLHSQ